jgi:hypothetical protein
LKEKYVFYYLNLEKRYLKADILLSYFLKWYIVHPI